MRKHFDTVINATTGLPVVGATISVTTALGAPVQLYSDNGAMPVSNPINRVTSGANGLFQFFVASGTYTLTIASGATSLTIPDVEIYDDSVSGLAAAGVLSGNDLVAILQGSTKVRTDLATIKSFIGSPTGTLNKTAAYNVAATDFGKVIRCDATSTGFAITLPATAPDGSIVTVTRSDATANVVIVAGNGGTELAWLSVQRDGATFLCIGNSWAPLEWNIAPVTVTIASTTTLALSPMARQVPTHVYVNCGIAPFTLTLPAIIPDGAEVRLSSVNGGYRVAVKANGGSDITWLTASSDSIGLIGRSGAWAIEHYNVFRQVTTISSATTLALSPVTADGDWIFRADAASGSFTITLPDGMREGATVMLRKVTSANRVTVTRVSGVELAWLSATGDSATFAWQNGSWVVMQWNLAPLRVVLTASGTTTKPPLAQSVDVLLIGGGGGGGSGRRGATGSGRTGGAGGASGYIVVASSLASSLFGNSIVAAVSAGGAGGTAITIDNSSGNNGTPGGQTSIALADGNSLRTPNSVPGAGGNGTSTPFANTEKIWSFYPTANGGATFAGSASYQGEDSTGAGAGGGGGSYDAANVQRLPGRGGLGSIGASPNNAGATGTSGNPGGNGSPVLYEYQIGGGGGGGGYSATGVVGTAGGNGGDPGGGGGGGAASDNGFSSGAGGGGGRGEIRFNWFF